MAKQYKVLVNTGKADSNKVLDIQQGVGDRGQPVRTKAQAGAKYELQEVGRKKPVGPDYIKAKRVGKDLHILFEDERQASLIIEDYYEVMPEGYNGVIGQAENGSFYEYIPEDPKVSGLIPALAEGGQAVNVALGGAEVTSAGAVAFAAFPLLGAVGLLGAGAVAAYYANRNNSQGTNGGDLSSASDSGNSNSDNLTKQNSNLVINGKGAPNSSVDVVIKDANGNTVYSGKATTDANGNYSYSVPGPLPDGQYTPFMNGAQGEPFTIDTSTRIDMTNAGKAGTTDPIGGTAEPGASVVVKDPNGNVIGTTTADASGNWSIKPASPVPAGEIRAEATDPAGNTASDPGTNGNKISLKTALNIDPIATDNVLTLAEQGVGSYNVTGKVTGKYATGDLVEFALNGKTYAATVAADGSFSVPVSMADLKADADTKIEGSITATGGDKATAGQDYTLESSNIPTQTALSINPVTADNIIGAAENTGNIAVTGKVTGKFAAGDVVTLTVNNKTITGAAAADGSYSISVPASDLVADSDTQIDGVVTGSGGTQANAIQDYGVDNSSTPTPTPSTKTALHLEPITANLDNILSQSEGASTTITVGGFVSGTFAEGDMVSLVLNGRTYTALVDNNGNYSVSVLSADLKADADKTIEASITGTGGSAATAAQTYQVETASNKGKITALSIDPVTSDNMLGSSETSGNIPVNGYVSGAFSVNDAVTLTINGKTFTGKPDSSGFFSIDVPATDLSSDSDTQVEGVVTGTGGTTAKAVQDYGVDSSNNRNLDPTPSGDTTAPTIEVERLGSGTLTRSETIRFTLSEASTNFNDADITITGGTLSQFTPVPTSGTAGTGYKEYTATFTPTANANGTATIGVAAGKFTDNAGNQNLDTFSGAAGTVTGQVVETNNLVSIAYNTQASPNPPADTTAPSIIVARAGSASLASGNTELITFTLSENSSTFTLADIDVSGGTLSGFAPVPGSGTALGGYHQYTAVFTPAANSVGTATIGVAAGQFSDAASNANTDTYVSGAAGYQANNLVSIGYNTQQSDTTKPSIEVSRAGSGTVTANETIYFTLSEASTTFTQDDIDVTGGTLSNFAPVATSGSAAGGYTQYTATFTPSANASGSATIGVDAEKFTDAAGNANADTYSSIAPDGVTQEDNNQVVLQYNTRTSPLLPDTTAPTIAVTADKATLAAGQTAQLSFVLSEPSTDFAQSDVQVSGGTLSNWVQVSPTQYSATFTPTAGLQGTGSVYVASNAFRDAANNPNADGADTNNTVNFITNHGSSNADTTAPTIAIARMGSGTLTSSETIRFTLSEASTTFGLGDITVTGGTLSQFTPVPTSGTAGSGYTHYTATFTPAANASGTATIGVAAGKFTDTAGNQNLDTFSGASGTVAGQVVEANNLVSIAYNTQANPNPPADTTAPTIVVERATTDSLASGNTELITFTLSENSSNFTLADIDVSGGTLSGLSPVPSSGTAASGYHQYTAVFTPAANSVGTATIGVTASKFSDAAGNVNQDDYRLAGPENLNNQVVIAYNTRLADTTEPTIEVTRAGSGTVGSTGETIYFTLSEASTTFVQSDIDVTGGTLSNFAPLPNSGTVDAGYTQYTATFTASAGSTGTATIGVASGKFTDAAGNNNQDTYLSPAPAGATTEANNQVSLNYNTSANPTPPADTTAPTIAISADKATLAARQSATVSFVLSEPSSDFIQGDVQVTGGTLSNWTQVNATTYTATYTAAAGAQGTGRISVASNAFRDAANNFNADGADANNTLDFITNYGNNGGDTTPPTIVVARTSSGTLTSSETLTFTLSEAATNFAVSDIDVTGGTLSNFSPVPTSGTPGTGYTQYTATFTPTANASGSATIGVAAGKFSDNAGNANQDDYRLAGAENTNNLVTIAYNTQANPTPPADSTAPSIVVARAGTGSLTSGGTDTITFTLSENASTFTLADIDVVGGVLSNFAPVTSSGSASTGYHQYTATFTPTANASGSATIGVAAGKFSDAAGNANQDTYVSGAAGYQDNNLVTIGYNTTQPDTTAPTIEVTRAGSGTVGSTGETIYFTLSEASTTFTLADIDVTGGAVSNLVPVASSASGTGYKQYTATFTPSAGSAGTATIGVASGKFTDLTGNANTDTYVSPAPAGAALEANNQISLSYNTQTNPATPDTTAPSVAVTIDKTVLSAGQSAVVTFTLSEASTTFAQSDVDITGGALSGWTQVSASVYTATFTPTANTAGTATIGVKSGTFSDTTGNLNADTYLSPAPVGASTESNNQVSLSYNAIPADTTAPSIIVSRTNAGTTLAAGANETISFKLSEVSLDFDISDVVVTGGTLSNFTPVPTSGTPGTGYTEFTASFTPSANSAGTATIGVAAGRFSDNAGNKNTDTYISGAGFEADNQVSLAYNTVPPDTTAPKIALSRKGSGSLVAGGSDEITFVLSESSTSFTLADIDVVGGTLTNFAPVLSSGDATRGYTDYTATFTPTANSSGLARIGVQSGKFTDTAGNANLDTYLSGVSGTTVEANNVIDITYNTSTPDTTAPSIVVSRAGAGMVSTSETIYFTLSEASTTFTQSDIDVQGGTLSGFAPVTTSGDATNGYTQYTATFTPTANSSGVATVGVKSGTFSDMAGNANADTYMSPAPTGATFETNNQVSLNFNTLVPDTTAPTIAIDRSGTGVVTGAETITFTLSEASTNFIASDIDVAGGTISGFAPVLSSGNASTGYTQYTATFTPTAGTVGTAWVAVASGKFTDAASNTNLDTYLANVSGTTQEANNTVEFRVNTDSTAPTVAIARANGQTTQTFTGPETITFSLSEDSSDFSAADVVVTGGTLSNFSGSGRTYTATFTPTANASGTASISVAHNTFSDAGGNANQDTGTNPAPAGATYEANNLITAPFNTDSTAPTVIVTRTGGASGTVTGAESITFTFSEAINPSSFVSTDIDAVGGSISNLLPDLSSGTAATGYIRYSATFTPTAGTSGTGSVGILATKFTDVAGNPNADSYALTGAENANNQVSFPINTSAPDTTPPTIAITRAGAGTVTGAETIYFTLSEVSTDFAQADIDVSGGSLSNFQQSSTNPQVYSATFTPAANSTATATIGVAAGKFKDAANNTNLDTYSGAPTAVSGQVVEGNNQLSLSVNTDTTAPTILVGRQGTDTVTGPITVTFALSEASTDFALSDIDAVGGTVSNLQGSGTSYTATFTPNANAVGSASVGVTSSKFSDAGGNFNKDTYLTGVADTTSEGVNTPGANIVVFQFSTDTTAPTIALSRSGATGATFTGPETITFTLSEASTDFVWNGSSGDINVSGGSLSALTQSSSNPLAYTATFTPTANASGTASISVASNQFSDSAGNLNQDGADANNTLSAPFNTVPADTTAPTVIVTRANGNTTQSFTGAETIAFTFSEAVSTTSFVSGDIDAVGGTLSNLLPDTSTGSASAGYTRYTATFTPTTAGSVSVGVDASRFADAAGNSNIDTYRSGISGTTQEANNQVSATYVPPATNATATIDILGMSTDGGTSAIDFKTNDQTLSFNGSITNWISTNGDRVMLEVYDADPTSGTFGQVLTTGFATPAANGTWTWDNTSVTRAAGLYTLKATIVSANGTTALNSTAPVNGTNGGWDNQAFTIDTTASNSSINLGVSITTDASNDGNVSTAELGGATTFTSRATFNSSAKAGDKITFSATNDGTALTPVTVTLTSTDITNGYVETTFAVPADSKTQVVTVNLTDNAGNVATDAKPTDSATLRLANNTTATIDITTIVDASTSSSDTGTVNNDFVTSDQTLTYKGTITGWVAGQGDRVMLQFYDNNNQQIGSNAFVTPATDGSWTWNDTATTRAAGTYSLKATIVSSSGTTALNSTAPTNGTGGGYDQQVVVIDTAAANSDVTLALSIRTDADNNTWVNASEIGSSTTFTSRATFANGLGSSVRAGDKITFNATNDGTALTPITVTLSSTDITNGYVETTFVKPADGKVQNVTASYTDLAGNAAAGTVSDSATLDTTTPTIIVERSGTNDMTGAETITFTLSEASTDFAWDAANQTGDIVLSGGTLGALSTTDNITYTATFTPTANTTGTASIGVQANAFKDTAANLNADDYRNTGTENTNNQVSASFNTVLPTATITQINGDGAPLAAPSLTITDATTGTAANSATTTFTFTFSQAVKGFAATDVTLTDSNGGSLTLTPTDTWADGQTVFTGTVTAPASGAGAYAVTVADGSYQSNSGNVPGYGNSNVQAYAASQDGYSNTVQTIGTGIGAVGDSIALSNGNYLWATTAFGFGVNQIISGSARLYDSSGNLIKTTLTTPTDFIAAAKAASSNTEFVGINLVSYAPLPGGGFVAAYMDDYAYSGHNAKIWVVKYDNNGNMLSTTLQANTPVVTDAYGGGLADFYGYMNITPTQNGNYVLAYAKATTAGSGANAAIYAVEINGSTNAIVAGRTPSLISASSFATVNIQGMDATTLADGKIVVSWAQASPDGVFTRVLNADGTPLSGSNVINTLSSASQYDTIKTIATPDGGFVVVSANRSVANNANNGAIKAVKYSVSGTTVTAGTVTNVSTENTSADNNKMPSAAVLTNGNVVIVWENEKALTGAFYRVYDQNLNPISTVRNVPGTALTGTNLTTYTLSHAVVTALPDGGFVIGIGGTQTGPSVTTGRVPAEQIFFTADGAAISRTGSTASDTQIGGDGADTLTGGGGADVILAGAGNDTVVINASNISNLTTAGKLLDGGTGIDTLRIGADASTLDLTKSAIQANVQNFEKIDLGSDAVANTVILNATAVQRLATQNLDGTSSNKQLIIDGTSSDLVKLSGQYDNGIQAGYWQQSSTTPTRTVGGITYKVYTLSGLSGVEVLVNNAITSANTDVAYQMASGDIVMVPSNSAIVGDLETTATGGSTGTGDGGSQQPANLSSSTSDVTPLVQGTLSQALSGTQVLKLFRTNVTDGGAAVEVSANVTTSGTNWQFQDSGLVAGKQYRYEARIMDGSTMVDASNTYTINEAVSTLPTNAGVTLAVRITTDIDNNTWVGPNEVGSATTFTSRATFGSAVKAGDVLTFTASNGSTALSSQSVTLTSTDISQGYVDVTFTKPSDGVTQTVSVTYTDSMGNAATDAAPTDSATLDTTAPTIALARTDSNGTVVSGVNTLKTGETGTITLTLSEAPASGTLMATDLISSAGGTIGTVTAVSGSNGLQWTVQYTPPVNGQGTDVITVAASVFTDAAGNLNQDTYLNPAPSGQTYQANNQVSIAYDTAAPTQTVTLSSMTKDSGTSGVNVNRDWSTSDGSAGRLLSGFISAPLGEGEMVKVYKVVSGTETFLGNATVASNGTTWAYTDTDGYNSNWTYKAVVVDAVGNAGTPATQAITLSTAATTSVGGETSGSNTITYGSTVSINTLAGDDVLNASTNTTLAADLATGASLINGGAGADTLRLAVGTTLNLAALTNNQTVTPLQEVEIIEMQGSSSVLSMTANNVLSLGGSHASTMSSYNFASVTNPQGGGTSSTGKVQMVVLGNTGDVLNLQGLANDGITGTSVNAGIFGNSNLAGSWSYKGDVVLGGVTYKVYDHSTTQAQVLAKVDVTVNTLTPIAITSIVDNATSSADTGVSATDFVTSDTTLTYKGTMPVLAGGEKVRVKILNSSNAVVYEGDATLNGTNWTFDRTSTALAAGNYTIQAQIVDSSDNPVASYGALGTATGPLKIDTGNPTIAVTASGSGNTRTVTFTLSEASTTFDATDVDMTNGQLSNFAADTTSGTAASGYTRYTATFTATSGFSGTATVGVLNNKFSDIAGNTNQDTYAASPTSPVVNDGNNQASFTVDGVPPTVAISSNQLYLNSTTNTATITFTFSEAVVQGSATNQFDLSDVVFSGGTLTALTPVTGTGDATNGYTQYTATFTATTNSTTDGFVGIQNGKFADAGGNLNRDTYVVGVTGAVQESDNALTMPVNTTGTVQVFGINGGGTQFTQSGFDLHGIGDVNGDGKEDFMIAKRGAFAADNTTVAESAKSYVVFGKDGLNINGLNLTSLETAGNGNGFVVNGVYLNNYYAATHGAGNYDYNGDGLADIVMNNYGDGKSYVVFGKTNTNPVNLSTGFQASDGFTIAVPSGSVYSTPVGDMNGDGFTDTFMAVNNGGYVLYGTSANTNVTIPSGQTGSSAMGFFVHASNLNTLSIVRAPVVGDFNGDGYSDFAVQESNGNSTGGALNVVFGGPSNIANLVAGDSNASGQIGKAGVGFQVTGFTRVDPGLGIPGTKSGDVNGDGLTDLIINNQTKSYSTNSVFVAFGKTDTAAVTTAELSSGTSTKGFRIFNSNFNSGGIEGDVDVVGDFNGDGLADLVVTNTDIYNVNGGAWLVYGKTTGTTIDLASINATDGFKIMKDTPDPLWGYNNWNGGNWNELGFAVAAAGDVNGDGFADLIVSNPHKDTTAASNYKDVGVTYVVYGGQFPSGSPTVFSAASGDKLGTAGNDTLTGTSGNNQIVAGAGDDTLTGGGGADVLYGGAGNDTFVINADNVTAFANSSNTSQGVMKVDGGTGLDTLKLDGSGMSLNLKTITAADLASVENIDITGSGSNTLTLSALDVSELGDYNRFNVNPSATDTRKQLMITGSSDDVLNLGTNWLNEWKQPATNNSFSFGGKTYQVYNSVTGNLQLLIDSAIPLDMTIPTNNGDAVQASVIQGGVQGYQAGTYVSGVGDVNGDGLDDFVVSTRSGGQDVNPSKSYVVFGNGGLNISGLNLTSLETAGNGKGFVINRFYNYIQSQVLTISGNQDYNGDGLMDMVVNDGHNVSYVVLGKTNTAPVNLTNFQASDGFTITAPYNSNVGTIGDFNGDGHVDTLLGLWNGSNWTNSYILFGDGTTTNKTFNAIGNTNSNGMYVTTDRDLHTNLPPVMVGDFNGDGYSDFATTETSGGVFKSDVVFGGPSSVTTLTTSPNLKSVGFAVTYSGSGTAYDDRGTKSGDINGDGLDDLIYRRGTTGQFAVVFGKTSTTGVDLNSLGTSGFKITYNNATQLTANGGVDIVGDFNGDGLSDMLVNIRDPNNTYNGGAWLIYGLTAATDINLATLNATDGFKIGQGTLDGSSAAWAPSSYNTAYGITAAAAGDLNGDGFADLLISDIGLNSTSGSTTLYDTGAVYVVYGGQFPTGAPTVFDAASGDKLGTAGNDTLAGTSGNNQILGGQGNDTLSGNGGADVLYGGSGNDTIVLNASNVSAFAAASSSQSIMRVDGGTGVDTLQLDGSGITLDLTAITHADLRSVEHFDITGSGNNTLRLSMRDVFDLGSNNAFDVNNAATDTRVQLMVTGDAGDAVQLTDLGSWTTGSTYSYGGETYRIYNAGNLQLLIDTAIVPTT